MFTGIVAAVGRIEGVESLGPDAGVRLTVGAGGLAIQGACMTAVSVSAERFVVEVSRESLVRTVGLDRPGDVNLEKALRLSDRLGGHLVTGHVDGIGEVAAFTPVGESWQLDLRVPADLSRFLAYKGSVTVDGTSLTVIRINLIPHTLQATTLGRLAPGVRVNLEIDLIARYVERMLAGALPHRAD